MADAAGKLGTMSREQPPPESAWLLSRIGRDPQAPSTLDDLRYLAGELHGGDLAALRDELEEQAGLRLPYRHLARIAADLKVLRAALE